MSSIYHFFIMDFYSDLHNDIDSDFGTEVVNFFVGPSKEHFVIHKKIICSTAPVFDKMFNGNFIEASQGSVELIEDDPKVFIVFMKWVYSRIFDLRNTHQFVNRNLTAKKFTAVELEYAKIYFFAQKYCLDEFKNDVISKLVEYHQKIGGWESLKFDELSGLLQFAMANGSTEDCLVQYYMDMFIRYLPYRGFKSATAATSLNINQMNVITAQFPDIAARALLFISQGARLGNLSQKLKTPCNYHTHGQGVRCEVKPKEIIPCMADDAGSAEMAELEQEMRMFRGVRAWNIGNLFNPPRHNH